jgi:hypothetical protein
MACHHVFIAQNANIGHELIAYLYALAAGAGKSEDLPVIDDVNVTLG